MAQTTWTKKDFWAELEALGEEQVRERLATKRYGNVGDRKALAEEWLRVQEESRKDASQSAQIEIARSAKDAAWSAAEAASEAASEAREHSRIARAANTRATIALIIAAASAIAAVMGVLLGQ